jgi:hypothetical protein
VVQCNPLTGRSCMYVHHEGQSTDRQIIVCDEGWQAHQLCILIDTSDWCCWQTAHWCLLRHCWGSYRPCILLTHLESLTLIMQLEGLHNSTPTCQVKLPWMRIQVCYTHMDRNRLIGILRIRPDTFIHMFCPHLYELHIANCFVQWYSYMQWPKAQSQSTLLTQPMCCQYSEI